MTDYLGPYNLAETALAAITAEYATAGVTMPAVAYVSTGDVAHDCEQITVGIVRLFGIALDVGHPNESVAALQCLQWNGVALMVTHLRCSPVGKTVRGEFVPPSNAEHAATTKAIVQDAEIARRGLVNAWKAGDFGEGRTFALESWAPISTEGGLTGGTLTVRISMV